MGSTPIVPADRWRKRQTRKAQTLVLARAYGFDSHPIYFQTESGGIYLDALAPQLSFCE